MGLPIDMVKARLKDKNRPYTFWPNIRDVMGKTSGDRHLALFAFTIYKLAVFPKALGYLSVELADFLFQIEKGVNPAPTMCLYKRFRQVFIPSTMPLEEFLES
ncbi:hypothetical protein Godav_003790 [Gossypium davidsonii]|uniref:Uncharacterized protein n=1 Tax=Gossypium davidsonii TaxID=34287 RepID=A0A7J8SIW8_GOSDV|nr:hypothetical protein [Gossypium davidsonii]